MAVGVDDQLDEEDEVERCLEDPPWRHVLVLVRIDLLLDDVHQEVGHYHDRDPILAVRVVVKLSGFDLVLPKTVVAVLPGIQGALCQLLCRGDRVVQGLRRRLSGRIDPSHHCNLASFEDHIRAERHLFAARILTAGSHVKCDIGLGGGARRCLGGVGASASTTRVERRSRTYSLVVIVVLLPLSFMGEKVPFRNRPYSSL
mmetsp:Transcript_25847/g.68388  ORF Transcript_25847/g.68388 Transcript_25847/m.68388 type:complete len:201 (+) Transcript_25847:257-859(+)